MPFPAPTSMTVLPKKDGMELPTMAFLEDRAPIRSRSEPDKRDLESGPTCSQWSERHPRAYWPVACGRRSAGEVSLNLRANGFGSNAHLVLKRRIVPATREYCQSNHQRQGLRTAETDWKYGSEDDANEVGSAANLEPTAVATAQEWRGCNAPSTWASPVLFTSLEVGGWLLMVLESCVLVQMDGRELGGVVDVGVGSDAK